MPQPRPDFLVIGGMKCGSTTLYRDLETHSGVTLAEKELNPLLSDTAEKLYARAFKQTGHTLRGDVSTHYTMRPQYNGVPERAAALLPPDTKLIYIVRDPIARLISHYRHWSSAARFHVPSDINVAVRTTPELTDWSCYATQLRPWVERFGVENIHLIAFEDYMTERESGFEALCRFLNLDTAETSIDTDKAHNVSDNKPVMNGFWTRVRYSSLYLHAVRPLLPTSLKERAKSLVMTPTHIPSTRPRPEVLDELALQFRPEMEQLQAWFGNTAPQWDSLRPQEPLAA